MAAIWKAHADTFQTWWKVSQRWGGGATPRHATPRHATRTHVDLQAGLGPGRRQFAEGAGAPEGFQQGAAERVQKGRASALGRGTAPRLCARG